MPGWWIFGLIGRSIISNRRLSKSSFLPEVRVHTGLKTETGRRYLHLMLNLCNSLNDLSRDRRLSFLAMSEQTGQAAALIAELQDTRVTNLNTSKRNSLFYLIPPDTIESRRDRFAGV